MSSLATLFPEISDDTSSFYQSPLTTINQKLRRKNVVAAAAVSGPNLSFYDSSDPWSAAADPFGGCDDPRSESERTLLGLCFCSQRRGSWTGVHFAKSPKAPGGKTRFGTDISTSVLPAKSAVAKATSGTIETANCTACGKKVMTPSSMAWGRTRSHRLQTSKPTTMAEEDPEHARNLLEATPKLRHISPASSDTEGGGPFVSRNILNLIIPPSSDSDEAATSGGTLDYRRSLVRDRANQQAASELASLLFSLFHEMSLEDYGAVESEVFTSVFALVHDSRKDYRMAGLAALDALIVVEAPSADEEKKGIKFANALSNGLRSAHGDFEFLSAVSKALGHMAQRTANVDFVESEVTRALEWLRTERSDRRYA